LNFQRTAAIEEPLVSIVDAGPLFRERTLKTSVLQLDELTGGLHSGQVNLFDSDNSYSTSLLHLLCVRAISEFDEEVVWIDGGNAVDPYGISSICKRLRLDKRDILSRVNISRAFTAYQLVTLIDEKLQEQVERSAPALVVVSSITEMFLDKDMKWMESHQLLRRCLERVAKITKEHETISIITNNTHQPVRPNSLLANLLYEHADLVLQMRTRKDGLLFRLPGRDREVLFSPVPWNQTTLDEFRGDSDGKDSAYLPLGA
jgi:predicted ATP-dependent serine protease